MKTSIIGKLVAVAEPVKKENYSSQLIEINVKEFDSSSGEIKNDMTFPITIFNKYINELNAILLIDKRVVCKCYLKSLPTEKEGKKYNNIFLNAVKLEEA
jgi:hypothetical protein